jgi:DNA polymerase I
MILIDGNAIVHRSFHALPPFKTSSGELVNAIYGFASVLLNILNTESPEYIAVAFDLKGPTFRHEEYKEYKATRIKAPDELYAQIPKIKDLVEAFGIPIFEQEGYEADDILGTLASQAEKKNILTYIVTGDMDALQLVTEKIKVYGYNGKFSSPTIYDISKVLGKYGLMPSQVPDMKGLQGDSSDNIKGVAGIGPKTAKVLLQKYKSIENIYSHIEEITATTKDKLEKDKESAFLSKKLATIIKDMDIELDLAKCKTHDYDKEKIKDILLKFEFKSLLPRLESFQKKEPNQPTLF